MTRVVLEKALFGGDPRSLGRAGDIVQLILRNPGRVGELFQCLFSDDEVA